MRKYKVKPATVEAIQWKGISPEIDFLSFVGETEFYQSLAHLILLTSTGPVQIEQGDWIVKGSDGEPCCCKEEEFKRVYKPDGGYWCEDCGREVRGVPAIPALCPKCLELKKQKV